MFQLPESDARSPYQRANSLPDLLSWSDLDFVRCAYVTILGRQPDLPGQANYVQRIRDGYSKLDVLWRLRRSPEGKLHDPGIAGLDRALKRAAWQRRPLLGALARLLQSDADGQSRNDRALRSLMNMAFRNQQSLEAVTERLNAKPAISGRENLISLDQSPPSNHAAQVEQFARFGLEYGKAVAHVPDLDHLRQKAIGRRFIDETPL